MKRLIISTFSILILASCSSGADWTGFYYPDKDNIGDESTWIIQEGFETIEGCRDWAEATAAGNPNYDYECGYKCRYDSSYDMNICKKTEK